MQTANMNIQLPSPWVMPGVDDIMKNTDAFEFITKMVCDKYELEVEVVMSKTRLREMVKPRQMIHSLLRTNFKALSLQNIGETCGGKDHATVLHSCRAVSNLCETDKYYREEYEEFDHFVKHNIKRFRQHHLKKKR